MNIRKAAAALTLAAALCTEAAAQAAMQICYDGATHLYTGSVYSLYVNGNEIHSAMEPIIFNDRALVPVREIFEECGAEVDYTSENRCVEIKYNGQYIRLYINNNTAYVNGKPETIPDGVVPKLIYKPGEETKTMVPVRFISETVGMTVDFDGDRGRIDITSDAATPTPEPTAVPTAAPTVAPTPMPTAKPTAVPTAAPTETPKLMITDLKTTFINDTTAKITITCDGAVSGSVNSFTLSDPERVVIDFANADFKSGADTTTETGKSGIKTIRTGVTDERARIVADVRGLQRYEAIMKNDNTVEIVIYVEEPAATAAPTAAPTASPTAAPSKSSSTVTGGKSSVTDTVSSAIYCGSGTLTRATAEDSGKVIMLDAGHGGSDPGAQGTLDGVTINEKDLTLTLTYKVKSILEEYGYKTDMTRTGDTLPSLSERPAQANAEGCALFVSIHINSADAESAHGTEVYWSEQNNGTSYGVTSEKLAYNILSPMLSYMGSTNRGVKMANWAVIRRSQMPAVLVEVGFISNKSELRKMCDNDYQDKVASGIAEGIINTVHSVTIP